MAAERDRRHCMMLENCVYGEEEMLAFNLIRKGVPGSDLSLAFPYVGAVVFSSSRESDAVWTYMDCSPYGKGHRHQNVLSQAVGRFR